MPDVLLRKTEPANKNKLSVIMFILPEFPEERALPLLITAPSNSLIFGASIVIFPLLPFPGKRPTVDERIAPDVPLISLPEDDRLPDAFSIISPAFPSPEPTVKI